MPETEKIILEYWKFFPERVLISDKIDVMTAQQFGAYWFIVCRMKMESLPGVAEFTEAKLMKWARLDREQWRGDRVRILAPFQFHAASGTLHHKFIQQLFRDYYESTVRARFYGRRGGLKKAKNKAANTIAEPKIPSPYAEFSGNFIRLDGLSDAEIVGMFDHAKLILFPTPPIGTLHAPSTPPSSKGMMEGRNGCTDPTTLPASPLGGNAVGGSGDDFNGGSIPLGTFLREAASKRKAK